MIEFDKAKVTAALATGKKGVALWRIKVVALVTEASAKALGDDVRNTLYTSKGVIRPSFGKMDLTHVFSDASFHLSVAGMKEGELQLSGVAASRFQVTKQGDGEKKPRKLVCVFQIEYINRATGASSIDLWNFVNLYLNGEGKCRLKYPEQQPMFSEKKEKEPEIVPGVHKYAGQGKVGVYTAEIRAVEHKDGWAATRKARAGGKTLQQKAAIIASDLAKAGPKTVAITKHTS